jgi:CheY-like chemotaxis protein
MVFDRILLVDDSANDAQLVQRALARAGLLESLQHISDPREAIAYLNGDAEYADRKRFPVPEIIFLDLKMPGIDGFQLLKWIRSQPHLARVVIIVLTRIDDLKLIQLAYQLGAQSFLSKDANFEEMRNVVRFLQDHAKVSSKLPRPVHADESCHAA